MRTKLWPLAIGLVLTLAFVSTPVLADPPVLEYLTGTIRPILEEMRGILRGSPKLLIVKKKFTTLPGTETVFNLDVNARPAPSGQVSRYTVTLIAVANFATVPANTDLIELLVETTDGAVAPQTPVASTDPSIRREIVQGPYTGQNSFIRVTRGADGLGPVDVYVNAYIENEPGP